MKNAHQVNRKDKDQVNENDTHKVRVKDSHKVKMKNTQGPEKDTYKGNMETTQKVNIKIHIFSRGIAVVSTLFQSSLTLICKVCVKEYYIRTLEHHSD